MPRSLTDGTRTVDGWQFHYNGWEPDEFDKSTYVRGSATQQNLKPQERKGCLDVKLLKRHGLTASRVKNDPIFFYQMLFPICHPDESGIENDSRTSKNHR